MIGFDSYFSTNKDILRSASQICTMFLYPARDALVSLTAGPLWEPKNTTVTKFWNGNTTSTSYSISHSVPTNTTWPSLYPIGDNRREPPHTNTYPRLTTKSNTFTTHCYVQTLLQAQPPGSPDTAYQTWREGTDVVTGESRVSTTVERYVDPADTLLPDFTSATTTALNNFYKFRVVSTKQFAS